LQPQSLEYKIQWHSHWRATHVLTCLFLSFEMVIYSIIVQVIIVHDTSWTVPKIDHEFFYE
ncbi:hypothetical protein, partial [Legionella pneumophila]|uniref:hypothetical protein n=1 Tax=Legionella pneumophila TaxID=446 RepID=UPI001E37B199